MITITESGGKLYVSFPYDPDIVAAVKQTSFRRWNPNDKLWEMNRESILQLRQLLPNQRFYESKNVNLELNKANTTSHFKDLNPPLKAKLLPHQQDFLTFAASHDRFILGDDMGLGKTIQAIALAVLRKRDMGDKHCLIITCVNGLKYNWQEEIEKFSKEKALILGTRVNKKGHRTVKGSKEKLEDLRTPHDEFFWIINVEALRFKQDSGRRAPYVIAEALGELCQQGEIGMVVVDEIHKANGTHSKQTHGLMKIEAPCMIAMTGTLITNHPSDAFVPLAWLKIIQNNAFMFLGNYAIKGGYQGKQIVGWRNLDQLNDLINRNMLRRTKDEVLDLPDKTRTVEYVELTDAERKYYKEILDKTRDVIAEMCKTKGFVSLQDTIAQWAYLRQVTGNANILFPDFNDSSKTARCVELVRQFTDNDEKVVVFSNWTSITDRLMLLLKDYNPALITGQIKDADRQAATARFQMDPDCKVIIGTDGAMGTGFNLTAGRNVIFMDSPWTMALKIQCEDRCYRVGTTKNVNVVTLVCKDTIDEYIEKVLLVKSELTDMTLNPERQDANVMMSWLYDNL